MVDYNATLRQFFAEIVKYLQKLKSKAPDAVYAKRIDNAINAVRTIASNPAAYAGYGARVKAGLESFDISEAFIPAGTDNNNVWLTYSAVLNSMGDLNSVHDLHREQARKKLLAALKTMRYKNSTNLLKDFTFPFLSPEHFGVKVKQNQK